MSPEYKSGYENVEQRKVDAVLNDVFSVKKGEDISEANLNVFLNGVRRAVNKLNIPSPKIKWIIDHIHLRLKKKQKVLVYSNWVKFGIDEIEKVLIERKIKYGKIIGSVSKKNRLRIMKDYNSNKLQVILITAAGAEGLDLKETRSVIIMEPFWHPSRMEQVIGRAIRYKSHAKLPEKDRKVDVYHLLLVKNKHDDVLEDVKKWFKARETDNNIPALSIDIVLFNLTHEKLEKIDAFYTYIRDNAIEKKQCV